MDLKSAQEIGAYIRETRIEIDLSIEDLSEKTGISLDSLASVEIGVNDLTASDYLKLADCLGVSVEEIITHKRPMFKLDENTSPGTREAVELVEKIAKDLDRLRALTGE